MKRKTSHTQIIINLCIEVMKYLFDKVTFIMQEMCFAQSTPSVMSYYSR